MLPLEQVQNICNPLRLKWRIANISKAPEKNKSNTHRATTLTPYQAPSQPSIDLIGPGTDISTSVAAITHWTITDNPHLMFQLTIHFSIYENDSHDERTNMVHNLSATYTNASLIPTVYTGQRTPNKHINEDLNKQQIKHSPKIRRQGSTLAHNAKGL